MGQGSEREGEGPTFHEMAKSFSLWLEWYSYSASHRISNTNMTLMDATTSTTVNLPSPICCATKLRHSCGSASCTLSRASKSPSSFFFASRSAWQKQTGTVLISKALQAAACGSVAQAANGQTRRSEREKQDAEHQPAADPGTEATAPIVDPGRRG